MASFDMLDIRALLAALLVSCSGCAAHWCELPDDCATAFHQTQLGWELHDVCHNCPLDRCFGGESCGAGCGVHVYDNAVWLDEPRPKRRPRMAVGPPPMPYQPPMPPKFLPVPAQPVFSHVNMAAPTLGTGQVEHGYRHELAFPAGD